MVGIHTVHDMCRDIFRSSLKRYITKQLHNKKASCRGIRIKVLLKDPNSYRLLYQLDKLSLGSSINHVILVEVQPRRLVKAGTKYDKLGDERI